MNPQLEEALLDLGALVGSFLADVVLFACLIAVCFAIVGWWKRQRETRERRDAPTPDRWWRP